MSISQPKIFYGTLEQPIHTNGQYLLMEAGITDGTYKTNDFIDKIKGVSLDGIKTEEGKNDVNIQRQFMKSFATMGDTITIQNFNPNREEIEKFINTTFNEMYDQLNMK